MITHVLKSLAAAAYLLIIFMLPFQWYRISAAGEIFPAIDLIFIYYLSTYKHLKYWQLFLAGLIIDQLYQLPLGISSLSLMAANFGLYIISTWLLLRDYFTNFNGPSYDKKFTVSYCCFSMSWPIKSIPPITPSIKTSPLNRS